MSITPSAKRSRAAAEEAGITSSLLEMALQLGEVEHSGARQLITEGLGSSGPAYQGEGYSIATDPYINSMVQLFPGDEGAHDPYKVNSPWGSAGEDVTLEGDEALGFLEKFNYGEYLKTAFVVNPSSEGEVESQWWYKLLSGELPPEKMNFMMGLMGYGVSSEGLDSFFSLLGESSPEQQRKLSELEQWMRDHCDFINMGEEAHASLVEKMRGALSPENAELFAPGEYQDVLDSIWIAMKKTDKDAIERGDHYEALLTMVNNYLSRELLEVASDYLMECQVHLDNCGISTIKIGALTFPMDQIKKTLEAFSQSFTDSTGVRNLDLDQWPGDILLAFSTLGSRLNFFTLAYYAELQSQYNNEWALAACDWNSMGSNDEGLERALGEKIQSFSSESTLEQERRLSALSYIVYGREKSIH